MTRYFFHLTNEDTIADEMGEEVDLVEEARGHALAVARELSRNAPPHRFAAHHISVVDEQGVVVFTTLLRVVAVLAVLLVSGIEVFS
jgi:acetylornithine/succinyldiaminopimelate/putrescine aminotransferase